MKEYEIIIETINPCGGTKHAQNEIIEAEAESPEAYVKEHGIFPVMDVSKNTSGDVIITRNCRKTASLTAIPRDILFAILLQNNLIFIKSWYFTIIMLR